MKGCTAAILRMCLSTDNARVPPWPQGLAQSNTARCSGLTCRAPSSVMAAQQKLLAASISARRTRTPPTPRGQDHPDHPARPARCPTVRRRNVRPTSFIERKLDVKCCGEPASTAVGTTPITLLVPRTLWDEFSLFRTGSAGLSQTAFVVKLDKDEREGQRVVDLPDTSRISDKSKRLGPSSVRPFELRLAITSETIERGRLRSSIEGLVFR